ncbi:helix-turn-helix domain-containing protein [Sciscionella sediminilitoris]|uniref:helix-turn-helix domain-containing protein n=1 Tax=Sciscionella sediminilitoris TaxID=1445613 RepID=UPI0004DF7BDC|nr:helix-turn-helix transcriptional regulator [Sciscionella sp. SE31]
MDEQLARQIGTRLRRYRRACGKTQPVVAELAGISSNYLYQLEQGKKAATVSVLLALAEVLDVSPATLLDDTAPAPPRATPSGVAGPTLHRAMTLPVPDETPPSIREVSARLDCAWQAWQRSPNRYSTVVGALSSLIVQVEQLLHLEQPSRTSWRLASQTYGLARTVAKRIGRVDLALVAAERAQRAALACGEPLLLGVAAWNSAHATLAHGHAEVAEEIALTATEPITAENSLDAAAIYGSLMLVAAMAAVRRGRAWTARERLQDLAAIADRTGELNTGWTAFGPTNLAMHAVSVELEAGQPRQARKLAENIDPHQSVSIERRVAFLLEHARAHQLGNDHNATLVLLQAAAREAPEDVAARPFAREILHEVIHHGSRTTANEAAHLAERLTIPLG